MQKPILSLVLTAALLVVMAGNAGTAGAHYKVDDKSWWFRGYTVAEDDGTVPLDPINVFFYRGGRITGDRVDNHIGAHAGLRKRTNDNGDECKGGSQYLTFVNYKSDRKEGADAKETDEVDRPRETGCGSRRQHLRFWDDLEHDLRHDPPSGQGLGRCKHPSRHQTEGRGRG